jgi:hypothetical protein
MHIRLRSVDKIIRAALFLSFIFLSALFPGSAWPQTPGAQTYRLIGSIQSRDFTGAVISDAKGEQSVYGLLDKLPDGSQIVEVRQDSISLKGADGTSYEIYIAHDMKKLPKIPYSTRDPYAEITHWTPKKHEMSWYQKQLLKRKNDKNAYHGE